MITRDFLKSVDLFSALDGEDAAVLAALAREQVFPKGQAVFREREPGDKLYLVLAGVVEIVKSGPAGSRPVPLAHLERGEILGEVSAFDGGPRSASAIAAVVPETRVAAWEVAAFRQFLRDRPRAAVHILDGLLRKMSARLRRTSEAVQTLVRAL